MLLTVSSLINNSISSKSEFSSTISENPFCNSLGRLSLNGFKLNSSFSLIPDKNPFNSFNIFLTKGVEKRLLTLL